MRLLRLWSVPHRREGKFVESVIVAKYVIPGFAYVVEVEWLEARVYGGDYVSPYVLRVTMIFGPKRVCGKPFIGL
jgi:hypothetical protein